MKLEILIAALFATGASAANYGTDRFGYALGAFAAVGFVLLWFRISARRGRPVDSVTQGFSVLVTLLAGAAMTPLLACWDKLDWVPRPDPLLLEWRILAGCTVGLVAGVIIESGLYFVLSARGSAVERAVKHGQTFGKIAVDAGADKLRIPHPPTGTTSAPPNLLEGLTPMSDADKQALRDAIPPEVQLSPAARRMIYGRPGKRTSSTPPRDGPGPH